MSEQNTKLLDKKIKASYESRSMSEDRLDRILENTNSTMTSRNSATVARRKTISLIAVAAVMLLAVMLAKSFIFQRDDAQLVFSEIAMNHNKRLDSEYSHTNYQMLAKAMQRLDFNLEPPAIIKANYNLAGGRYCSIRGNIAAQLKIVDKQTGKKATLYVTKLNPALEKIAPDSSIVDQTKIELWQSENNFYGLATD